MNYFMPTAQEYMVRSLVGQGLPSQINNDGEKTLEIKDNKSKQRKAATSRREKEPIEINY
jgi:hypothetical protein